MLSSEHVWSRVNMTAFSNPVIKEILGRYKLIRAIRHSVALMEWDLEVNMPEAGSEPRAFTMAQQALMRQKATLDLGKLVEKAERENALTDPEKGVIRVLRREIDYFTKVPPALVEELQRTTAEASVPWRESRRKSEFQIFKPYLSKIVDLKLQEAEKLGYKGHPYNALLDIYEEGLTVDDLNSIFSMLVPNLKRILEKARTDSVFAGSHPLKETDYDTSALKRVNEWLLALLGMPEKRFRMDISTHPFTAIIARDDVRITTRYEGKDFQASMFSVIHECGHALYELQMDPDFEYTPVGGGVSGGFHESQSRFWENMIGRSRQFISAVYPVLDKNLGFLSNYNEDQVYHYFNTVRPSLIRVDADELTYNLHIALRFELERKMLSGKVSVSDLPSTWDDMMEDYLGIRPGNDSEGVLQDGHWSGGAFAIFTSYTLGNVIAGMIRALIKQEGLIGPGMSKGDIEHLKKWLQEKIHRWGAVYAPSELLKKTFGKEYDASDLVEYLEQKYITKGS